MKKQDTFFNYCLLSQGKPTTAVFSVSAKKIKCNAVINESETDKLIRNKMIEKRRRQINKLK